MIVGDQFIKASFSSVDFFLYSIRAEQKKPRWVGFLVNVMGKVMRFFDYYYMQKLFGPHYLYSPIPHAPPHMYIIHV